MIQVPYFCITATLFTYLQAVLTLSCRTRYSCVPHSTLIYYLYILYPIGQTVRLVNSNNTGSQYEGRIEIFHNGVWGTICDHDWDLVDAKVACRMLGFSGALRAVTNAYYGRGAGRVWLDNVECTGTETSLLNCSHSRFGSVDSNCLDHHNDAGVVCFDGRFTQQVSQYHSVHSTSSKHFIPIKLTSRDVANMRHSFRNNR